MSDKKEGHKTPTDLLRVTLKHVFGLSDHLIQRIHHTITNGGESADMQRRVRKIPTATVTQLYHTLDKIEDGINKHSHKVEDEENQMDNKSVSLSFEGEETFDFKSFLLNELNALQAATQQAKQQGLSTQGERKAAGTMSDREFALQQAEERKKLELSQDPLDRRILALKRQLDALYKQKEQQANRPT